MPNPVRRFTDTGAVPPQAVADNAGNNVLGNLLRFVDRPGAAARSFLSGHFKDYAANIAQMGLDLPTGGWIDKDLSLAHLLNYLPTDKPLAPGGDLTTEEDRPDFNTLMKRWGVKPQTAAAVVAPLANFLPDWGRDLATNVAGGALTDPLSFVNFGSGGIAKNSLAGVSRGAAASRVAKALRATHSGSAALESGVDEAARAIMARAARQPGRVGERMKQILADRPGVRLSELTAEGTGINAVRLGAMQRKAETLAVEKIMRRATGESIEAGEAGAKLADDAWKIGMDAHHRDSLRRITDDTHRLFGRTKEQAASEAEEAMRQLLGPLSPSGLMGQFSRAGRRVGGVDEAGRFERFTGYDEQAGLVEAGRRALEDTGLIHTAGAFRFEVPFTKLASGPITRDVWSKIGEATPLGFLPRATRLASRVPGLASMEVAADAMEAGKATAWGWARRTFSRVLDGDVKEGLRDVARDAGGATARRAAEVRAMSEEAFSGLPLGASHVIGSHMIDVGEKLADASALRLADDATEEAIRAAKASAAQRVASLEKAFDDEIAMAGAGRVKAPEVIKALTAAAELRHGKKAGDLAALRVALAKSQEEFTAAKAAVAANQAADATARTLQPVAGLLTRTVERTAVDVAAAQARVDKAFAAVQRAEVVAEAGGKALAGVRLQAKALEVTALRAAAKLGPVGVKPEDVVKAISAYVREMTKIPAEMEALGVWKAKDVPDMFYMPRQANEAVGRFLAAGAHNDGFMARMRKDVFRKERDFKTHKEWVEHLASVAREHEVPIPEGVLDDAAFQVQNLDLRELFVDRLLAHARTVERMTVTNEATRRFGMKPGDAVDVWVRGQFEALPQRGTVMKLLGGGTFKVPMLNKAMEQSFRKAGYPIGPGAAKGTTAALLKSEGINAWFKPFMTVGVVVPFPAFVARNVVSSMIQGMLDPDIGMAGAWGLFKTMTEAPGIRVLSKGNAPNDIAKVLRAIKEPADEAAQAALKGVKIGTWTGEQVVRHARAGVVTGAGFSEREIMEAFTDLPRMAARSGSDELLRMADSVAGKELLSSLPPARLQLLQRAVSFPAKISQHVEDSFRLSSYMALLSKGVDPTEAAKRVATAFVDYKVNTATERMIRDLIPFARYTIGAAPPTIAAVAKQPRTIMPLANLMRSPTDDGGEPEGLNAFMPEGARNRAAIPVGADDQGRPRLLSGLGTPFEAAADALSVLPRPTGGFLDAARKTIGGGLTPLVKAPLEAAAGVNFFTGQAPGANRVAPGWVNTPEALGPLGMLGVAAARKVGLVTEVNGRDGKKVTQVPGWVNAWLLGALPWSRANGELNRLLDQRKEPWQRILTAATGAKVESVDRQKQARRALEAWLQAAAARGEIGKVENFFGFHGPESLSPELAQAIKALRGFRETKSREAKREQRGIALKQNTGGR